MMNSNLYFRARASNATVFRINKDSRRKLDLLTPIATVVYQSGRIKPREDVQLSNSELSEIQEWLRARDGRMKERMSLKAKTFVYDINEFAEWVQNDATQNELQEIVEETMTSMHDLRTTLIRRISELSTKELENDEE